MTADDERLLVQIASYNTNLQGLLGLPQDLVDWLSPTLQVSTFLSREPRAPDIIAVGFQELLPLHLGLAGLSKSVIKNRDTHILSEIEAKAPNKEKYSLVAKIANVGVALFVYARDDGVARKLCDVQTQWIGSGPCYMGNKGAVGVRFRTRGEGDKLGETFTFVCAHLTAHAHRLPNRIADYRHIVGALDFPPVPSSDSKKRSTIYSTSHLFFLGDLNFRLDLPPSHSLLPELKASGFARVLESEANRELLKESDQLTVEQRKGTCLIGLREGEFWKFKCSYKYKVGKVDHYSGSRTPSWTDRILYTTYSDSLETPTKSNISNILYTSIPSYTTSDHKPIVCLLLLPPPSASDTIPLLQLPPGFSPQVDPYAVWKRYTGRFLDRLVGIIWFLFTLIGAGSAVVGIFNFFMGIGAWNYWSRAPSNGTVTDV